MAGVGAVGGADGGLASIGAAAALSMPSVSQAPPEPSAGNAAVDTGFDAAPQITLGAPDPKKVCSGSVTEFASVDQVASTYAAWSC